MKRLLRLLSGRGNALPVDRATLVMSFDYERGFAGEDPQLADAGLESVLAGLARRGLRATFCCVAKIAEAAPERLRQIIDGGHEIACHGYAHESPRDLPDGELRAMLGRCIDAMGRIRVRPLGFRSPQSHWDERLMRELAAAGFAYSAERDRVEQPYVIESGPPRLVRMPIVTDDWDYVRPSAKGTRVEEKHSRLIRAAARGKHFVGLGYHPWVLAVEPARMEAWERTLDDALGRGVRVCAFADLLG